MFEGRGEDCLHHPADPHGSRDVVHAYDAATRQHTVRGRAQRLDAPVGDVEVEQLADEALVRCREQERIAERREPTRLAQQHGAHRGRLPEIEPRVEHDLLRLQPRGLGAMRALDEKRLDLGEQVVVVRLRIGNPRLEADVRRHDGRLVAHGNG